jgi:hypothetical protein
LAMFSIWTKSLVLHWCCNMKQVLRVQYTNKYRHSILFWWPCMIYVNVNERNLLSWYSTSSTYRLRYWEYVKPIQCQCLNSAQIITCNFHAFMQLHINLGDDFTILSSDI